MDLFTILDNINELVYISDIETYDLLYINRAMRKRFGIQSIEGKKCYELLQGLSGPCPFCSNGKLEEGSIYQWEHTNPIAQRHGTLRDMLIEYQGHKARVEIVDDITDDEANRNRLEHALKQERITVHCIRTLYGNMPLKESIPVILKAVGGFLQADRTYIFEIRDGIMNNRYEWCSEGAKSYIDLYQSMDISLLGTWEAYFEKGRTAIIHDIHCIRETQPEFYAFLKQKGIKKMMLAPITINESLTGYVGVDNPRMDEYEECTILDTLSYFISIAFERTLLQENLIYSSYYDTLTGLYNRNRFMEDTERFQRSGSDVSMGIVYVDVNGLKEINDNYGHQYGDRVLVEAANLLRDTFASDLIYRIGGDEFVVLNKGIDEETLSEYIKKLKNGFLLSPDCKGAVGHVWVPDCRNLEKNVIHADEKMYRDKMHFYRQNPLTNRYRHTADYTLRLCRETNLRQAIEKKNFEVFLQPKVEPKSGALMGAEALVRYWDEDGKLVTPDQFISLLEGVRLIHHIDFFVFEEICRIMKEWEEKSMPVTKISVNISRYTLIQPDFVSSIERIWEQYKVPKNLLEIEILSGDGEQDYEAVNKIMEAIKDSGFSISLDDFGSDDANLELFLHSQPNTLKVDRRLMKNIMSNQKALMLMQCLGQMSRTFDISMIVEGVETEEQYQLMKDLGCDGIQGYYIGRPVPIPDFETRFLLANEYKPQISK